ncbi:hypothetical protein [Inquilinus sp. CA228]|uniref:hypothetical protein n=1 Tax=Inquilinus sp. CA228 TaxID=3455609 RepID=UPI003F8CFA75
MRTMLKYLVLAALPVAAAPLALASPPRLAASPNAPAVILTREDDRRRSPDDWIDGAGAVWEPQARGHDETDAKGGGTTSEVELASDLARIEVYVGIRVEQLDSWRDYTAALQDLLAPRRKLEGLHEQSLFSPPGPKDPFDREQKLAEEFARRGQAAERLTAAIAALRTTLTPAQLDRLAWAGRSKWLRIPHGPFGKTERTD